MGGTGIECCFSRRQHFCILNLLLNISLSASVALRVLSHVRIKFSENSPNFDVILNTHMERPERTHMERSYQFCISPLHNRSFSVWSPVSGRCASLALPLFPDPQLFCIAEAFASSTRASSLSAHLNGSLSSCVAVAVGVAGDVDNGRDVFAAPTITAIS